ncbi:MAG: hypothetical protein CMP23_07905 [Rickettsiales bacterium]|nr:hypothetical protein [Rickettsiales bacterium]|tara:strand:- start:1055 stop:1822 length:768 start_codon:yes stop_codon:yes gene_type:complete
MPNANSDVYVLILVGEFHAERLAGCWRDAQHLTRSDRIFLLCAEACEQHVIEACPGLRTANIVLPPEDRGTAPAITLAMVQMGLAGASTHDPVLLVRGDEPAANSPFASAAKQLALRLCVEQPALVCLASPATGPTAPFAWLGLGSALEVADETLSARKVLQVRTAAGLSESQQYRDSTAWCWAEGSLAFRHGYMGYLLGEVREELDVAMLLAGCLQQDDHQALAAEYALMPALSFEEAVLSAAPELISVQTLSR